MGERGSIGDVGLGAAHGALVSTSNGLCRGEARRGPAEVGVVAATAHGAFVSVSGTGSGEFEPRRGEARCGLLAGCVLAGPGTAVAHGAFVSELGRGGSSGLEPRRDGARWGLAAVGVSVGAGAVAVAVAAHGAFVSTSSGGGGGCGLEPRRGEARRGLAGVGVAAAHGAFVSELS